MTSKELRQKYIDFFKSKGHTEIPSASLIPENDPSTLFVTAGMQPIVPFLCGEKHPGGARLVNVQKCVRTGDIDEVGDKTHHTFFEMLGHWSLGEYFKKEGIDMTYEFLTKELGLEKEKLAFTVFGGSQNAKRDEESYELWQKVGIDKKRIKYVEDNWWEPSGTGGPCGPDTEFHYWMDKTNPPEEFDPKDSRWVEIGNDVLMSFEKAGQGEYIEAKQKNIDNGTGLERLLAVMNELDDNYKTDLFLPIISKIEELSHKKYGDNEETDRSIRIIADHIRAAVFIMADNALIEPSNIDQGYVVRKLIRRTIRHGKLIGIKEPHFTFLIAQVVINLMSDVYTELRENRDFIQKQIVMEEFKFVKTLWNGLKELERLLNSDSKKNKYKDIQPILQDNIPSGSELFMMFSSYGFPLELSLEEIDSIRKKSNFPILTNKQKEEIINEFNESFKKHQDLSRSASTGKFKGGLGGENGKTIAYHTATHLLHQALREVLGSHVEQRGSNITQDRLRFDFSHNGKMADEEKKKVEDIVNQKISEGLNIKEEYMSVEEAQKQGAIGLFKDKYGEKVKVYSVGDYSKEICGGPHVKNTFELGHFKIKKEESSSRGVRRIKAVLE
ncbi:MAG: alanine--tRNA ligase [Candidatus Kuenenbacteria bacterium]